MRNDNSASYSTPLLEGDSLYDLIELLQAVDLSSPLAKLNESTITDNNGGRIEL